jgi:hypothetical protein
MKAVLRGIIGTWALILAIAAFVALGNYSGLAAFVVGITLVGAAVGMALE